MIEDLLRRIQRRLRLEKAAAPGMVDPALFADGIATYRRRGAQIGQHVRLMGLIDGVNPQLVSIGDYSVIGVGSALLAHCPIRGAAPCRVGRFVYLAYGVIVLPGVTIGDHSLVGAGAVVTRDVPEGSIVAGNPARMIRALTGEERNRIRDTLINGRLFGWAGESPLPSP